MCVCRMRRGGLPENEEDLLSSLGSYCVIALEGRTGEERWAHSPSLSDIVPAYSPVSHYHTCLLVIVC